MTREEFERIVDEEFGNAIPEKFRAKIQNVAFLIDDEPSPEVRKREGLGRGETLLGYYHGVPYPIRGDWYGMGATLPDTITLYQVPIEEEARRLAIEKGEQDEPAVRKVVRETIWHEVAHHFGFSEEKVAHREALGGQKG